MTLYSLATKTWHASPNFWKYCNTANQALFSQFSPLNQFWKIHHYYISLMFTIIHYDHPRFSPYWQTIWIYCFNNNCLKEVRICYIINSYHLHIINISFIHLFFIHLVSEWLDSSKESKLLKNKTATAGETTKNGFLQMDNIADTADLSTEKSKYQ